MNSEIGKPYISPRLPSRFVAVVTGNVSELIHGVMNKISVDAQLTIARDWEWVKINHNVGPFMNAADKDDEVNCILDRHSLWQEDGLHKMLMKSCKLIRKGKFLHWKYNPKAGPGGFFKFS
jgi:hypothetical protein